jgi:hypothetical protein
MTWRSPKSSVVTFKVSPPGVTIDFYVPIIRIRYRLKTCHEWRDYITVRPPMPGWRMRLGKNRLGFGKTGAGVLYLSWFSFLKGRAKGEDIVPTRPEHRRTLVRTIWISWREPP